MVPWHIMVGLGIGLLASIITIVSTRQRRVCHTTGPKSDYFSPPNETCAICLDSMTGDGITYLNCGHVFHDKCLQDLKRNQYKNCPTCRRPI